MKFGGILETAARNAFLSCFAGSVANQAYFLLLARVKTSIEHFGTHRREAHVRKMKFFFGAGGGGGGGFLLFSADARCGTLWLKRGSCDSFPMPYKNQHFSVEDISQWD